MPKTLFDYQTESQRVLNALRSVFPENTTIVTEEGYNGRVFLKIVSTVFNGKKENEKQAYIWDVLRDQLGEDSQAVSLVVPYGTDEL